MLNILVRGLAIVAAAILLLSGPTTDAQASDKIAFVKKGPDNVDYIHLMDTDGTNITRLTNNTFPEGYPSWSPDGSQLVFEGYYNGVAIYLIDADGTNQRRLSSTPAKDVRPSWSHDGSKIVFSRVVSQTSEPFPTSIMTMNLQNRKVTTILSSKGEFNIEPRWSPDGSKITFMSNRAGGQHIFTMDPNGKNIKQITTVGRNGDPNWSPDGSRITFGSDRSGVVNVFTMYADGTWVQQVTRYGETQESLSAGEEGGDSHYSPDGTKLVYEFDLNGNGQSVPDVHAEVRMINADGTGTEVILGDGCSAVGCAPRWRPGSP